MFSTRIPTFCNIKRLVLLYFGGDFILAGLLCFSHGVLFGVCLNFSKVKLHFSVALLIMQRYFSMKIFTIALDFASHPCSVWGHVECYASYITLNLVCGLKDFNGVWEISKPLSSKLSKYLFCYCLSPNTGHQMALKCSQQQRTSSACASHRQNHRFLTGNVVYRTGIQHSFCTTLQ